MSISYSSINPLTMDFNYFCFQKIMPKAEKKTKNVTSGSSNVIQDLDDIIIEYGGEGNSQEKQELLEFERLAEEAEQAVLNIPQPLSPIPDNAPPLAPLTSSARVVSQMSKKKLSIEAAKSLELLKNIKKSDKTPAVAATSSSKQRTAVQSMPQLVETPTKTQSSSVTSVWPPLDVVAELSASQAQTGKSHPGPSQAQVGKGHTKEWCGTCCSNETVCALEAKPTRGQRYFVVCI